MLPDLVAVPHLQDLRRSDTPLTAKSFERFKKMKSLTILHLIHCASKEQLEALSREMPRVKIVSEHGTFPVEK